MPVSSSFAPHVGALFSFGGMEMRLTEVDARAVGSDGRGPFILVFAGIRHPVLPEGSYDTILPDGQALALYISPIHTVAGDRQDYQVAFN